MWAWLTDPVVSLLLSLVAAIIGYLIQPRVRIVWTVTHGFIHYIKGANIAARQSVTAKKNAPLPSDMNMWAQTLLVMNRGRAVAENVEIVLNWKPLGLTVWPHRQYSESHNPDGKYILKFDTLSAQETTSLQMLDAKELPHVFNIRCSTSVGSFVTSQPQILYPKWVLTVVWILLGFGFISLSWLVIYGVITTLRAIGILPS